MFSETWKWLRQLSLGYKILVGSAACGTVTMIAGLVAGAIVGGPAGLYPIVRYSLGFLLMIFGLGMVVGLYVHAFTGNDCSDQPN